MHPNHDTAVTMIRSAIHKAQTDGMVIGQKDYGIFLNADGFYQRCNGQYLGPAICPLAAVVLYFGNSESECNLGLFERLKIMGVSFGWSADFIDGFDNERHTYRNYDDDAYEAGQKIAKELGLIRP